MIIASCPTRISLGSADHEPFSTEFGGVALSICINKRVYVILRKRNKLEDYKYRVSYSKTELCNNVDDIQLDIVREAVKMVDLDTPLEIVYLSDIPSKLGLATSSSFILALLKALYCFKNINISNDLLMDKSYVLEREVLKQEGGFQDYICCLGGFNYLTGYSRNVVYKSVPLDLDRVQELEQHCLLIYTGEQEESGNILSDQLSLLRTGITTEETLRIKDTVNETYDIIRSKDFKPMDIASLIKRSWEHKKKLSQSMTTTKIQRIEESVYNVCPEAGLRLVGSGGGRGLVLVISPPHYHAQIAKDVLPLKCFSSVEFDVDGLKVIKLWQ